MTIIDYSNNNEQNYNNFTNLKNGILTYDDGSCYIGQLLNGKKHGKGILSTRAFVYTAHTYPTEEDAMFAKWFEYEGEWLNDKMDGYGKLTHKCRNGYSNIIYDGKWKEGTMLYIDYSY